MLVNGIRPRRNRETEPRVPRSTLLFKNRIPTFIVSDHWKIPIAFTACFDLAFSA